MAVALLVLAGVAKAEPPKDIAVNPQVVDLGSVPVLAERTAWIELNNLSDRSIAIRRVRSTCRCFDAVKPPNSVPAGGSVRIQVRFKAPEAPVLYDRSLYIYTDSRREPKLSVRITAHIYRPYISPGNLFDLQQLLAGDVLAMRLPSASDAAMFKAAAMTTFHAGAARGFPKGPS